MVLTIVGKILWSVTLYFLQKTGVISTTEAWGIKTGTHVLKAVENLQIEDIYPPDRVSGVTSGNRE